MKRLFWPVLALVFCVAAVASPLATAAESGNRPATAAGKANPGLEMAQAISTITGVAISPLLGVSGVGAWKWWNTPSEKRPRLVWYAQPWFWVPALLLVLIAFVKDTFGTVLPTAVKKPFDVAEAIENKISGLVAAGAFVPLIATIFSAAAGDDGSMLQDMGLAMIDLTPLLNVLTIPAAVVAFVVVFMVSHVINVLLIISPFTTVDAALKSVRLFFLTTVAGSAFVNPYAGALWSLLLILVCFLIAGWAFRLMIFGNVFTWDMITFRKNRFTVDRAANLVFTAREISRTPIRSYGRMSRCPQGDRVLSYRPWLILPRRTLTLPPGNYAVGRGLFYSEVIQIDGEETTAAMSLPPRYRSHEEEFRSVYGLGGVQDIGFAKGVKAIWNWMIGKEEVVAA
jgi:hypothetical protein